MYMFKFLFDPMPEGDFNVIGINLGQGAEG
jgi:hypothetical protein